MSTKMGHPFIIINLNYEKSTNFIGDTIKGYKSSTAATITLEAGKALKILKKS